MMWKRVLLVVAIGINLLSGCAETPPADQQPEPRFNLAQRKHLYALKKWSFDGRLSLADGKESWSATIVWSHTEGRDEIKLSGPLGQGAAVITLTNDLITVDRGDEKSRQSTHVDEFIQLQLGIAVPVRALSYWVVGLTHPGYPSENLGDGFEQLKWRVHYLQLQNTGKDWLPRKIGAEQGNAKLKLLIDKWTL
jgi:outer membrane lipoprotein LolB